MMVNEHKYVDVNFGRERTARKSGLYQHDYGQILRVFDLELPEYVTVDFSLADTRGSTETRVGKTTDGCLEVQIPNELLKNSHVSVNIEYYMIYAYIYVSDETSGNTVYKVILQVKTRSKPSDIGTDPEDKKLLDEAVNAVNAAASRAETAENNAKQYAADAKKASLEALESATAAEKNKEDALREVGEKKKEAIEAIQEQEETSVGKIVNHTDNEIKRIQNQTADSKAGLEQTIKNADVSKRKLDESIKTAGDTKTALDKSTELAGTAKTELDTSTQKAGEAKTALDGSAKTAGEMQETLSATVKQAGTLDTSLGEKIETGTQLKTDLTVSGEKAVQDIQTAGSEQLSKMQAVAEEFTADREQIATNKKNIGSLKEDLSNKITKFYASNLGETHITDSDNGKIQDMMLYGKSSQNGTPSPANPVEIKCVVNPTVKVTNEDGLKVQSVMLNNITLNAIPVSSGGNVTINGQQYIADYVDVERGKLVKKLKSFAGTDMTNVYTWGVNANADNITGFFFYYLKYESHGFPKSDNAIMMSTILRYDGNVWGGNHVGCAMNVKDNYIMFGVPTYVLEDSSSDENACASFMKICENTNAIFLYSMASPVETDLTPEEIEAFKALVTNYPATKISVTSDQLDGYTVFNYQISLANGWNYVKQQLNDNRDYIYDMDLQSAEAYVNSEYAVALTELEV